MAFEHKLSPAERAALVAKIWRPITVGRVDRPMHPHGVIDPAAPAAIAQDGLDQRQARLQACRVKAEELAVIIAATIAGGAGRGTAELAAADLVRLDALAAEIGRMIMRLK